MALIGTERIAHRILRVGGGDGESSIYIEGGGDRWFIELGRANSSEVYSTVVEQLALQGYRLIAVEDGVSTLQLESPESQENAGATSLYIVRRAGAGLAPPVLQGNAFSTPQIPGVSSQHAAEIVSMLRAGQKIQAIKAIREANPALGLKEAKDIADSLHVSLGGEVKKSGGCVGVLLLLVALAGALQAYL